MKQKAFARFALVINHGAAPKLSTYVLRANPLEDNIPRIIYGIILTNMNTL